MNTHSIYLGREDRLKLLYSYPNGVAPGTGSDWSLATTILHWFNLTLKRDGLAALGARASVRVEPPANSPSYFLDLSGPEAAAVQFPEYGKRIPQKLAIGWDALNTVVPQLQAAGKWDPDPDPAPYRPWRFFLPFGMPMLNQRSVQFFHYPPIRLLETFQDYLYDPVPIRWNELLAANGVSDPAAYPLYSRVIDATPIAAEDDQGSKTSAKGDPEFGLIPIQYFPEYQKRMTELLLNPAPNSDYYTVPVVVYGGHPKVQFNNLYGTKLGVNVAGTAQIIPGKKTAALGANHPYLFYYVAQSENTNPAVNVGSGKIVPANLQKATATMVQDLIVARWQKVMSDDPTQDPQSVLQSATTYWNAPEQVKMVNALVQHQGSLLYPDPQSLDFLFAVSLEQAMSGAAAAGA